MLNWSDHMLWIFGGATSFAVVGCTLRQGLFLRYFAVNCYLLATTFVSVLQYITIQTYGFTSRAYVYVYYYTDCILTLLTYLAILSFFERVFEDSRVAVRLRLLAAGLLAATTLFSYSVIQHHQGRLATRFVIELSQNLYFVGLILTVLLWVALVRMHESRLRLIHLVLSLGAYFAAYSALYALRNLFPHTAWMLAPFPPLLGVGLTLAWLWAFARVSEEKRAHLFQPYDAAFSILPLKSPSAAYPRTS